jgi:hypothetical protein
MSSEWDINEAVHKGIMRDLELAHLAKTLSRDLASLTISVGEVTRGVNLLLDRMRGDDERWAQLMDRMDLTDRRWNQLIETLTKEHGNGGGK